MIAMTMENLVGLMWLAFWAMSTAVVICFFAWALRTKQFSNPKHAANLPLEAGDLEDEDEDEPEGKE